MLILNDIHLGFRREAGTTPASREALRTYLYNSFDASLSRYGESTVMIVGDLFDDFEVSGRDWLDTYRILRRFVLDRRNRLIIAAGNHDHSDRANKVSSFQMLCEALRAVGEVTVIGINESYRLDDNIVLAHCANQEIFNQKLQEILDRPAGAARLFLHANFDNKFAAESDHSLNVSREQAEQFIARGTTLVFAHEHQARCPMTGVVVLGNQWPTSIADCIGNNHKFAHILANGILTPVETWAANKEPKFCYRGWQNLSLDEDAKFVRVQGDATAAEAGEVMNLIAKFRQQSDAYIISNAVRVDGIVQDEELPATFEDVKGFDVMSFITERLDPEEVAAVNKLKERIEQ